MLKVGGVQQILLHVKVMEVSRTKLRNLVEMEQRAGTVDRAFAIDRLTMPDLTELTD